jgi:hypothetical protein
VDDVHRTLDASFSVRFVLHDDESLMFWAYDSGATFPWSSADDEAAWRTEQLVLLSEAIPDFAFDDVQRPWPRCPDHRGDDAHPLYPEVRDGRAMWVCRRSDGGAAKYEIGQLPASA